MFTEREALHDYGFESLGASPDTHPPKALACGSCPVSMWRFEDDKDPDKMRQGRGPQHLPYRLKCRCLQMSEEVWKTGQQDLITRCTAKNHALNELREEQLRDRERAG